MISLRSDGEKHKKFTFPGGEVHVRLGYSSIGEVITAHIRNSDDVMELLMLTDALRRRHGDQPIHLVMPYLPYARQDRVCVLGEALSLKVFCNLINAQNYASVEVWDCHSDVGLALLDRVIHKTAAYVINSTLRENKTFQVFSDKAIDYVVIPDAGAGKRATAVANVLSMNAIQAEKVRDPATGGITGTVCHTNHIGAGSFIIVDDICDGGRTFIELARVLRPKTNGKIILYVTHGIFSAGFDALREHIDHIYTANSFIDQADLPDFVTQI